MNTSRDMRDLSGDTLALQRPRPPELSVVVPTFNEAKNLDELIVALEAALVDESWEVIFVDDDSPDGTADLARDYARKDSRVRVVQRVGRRGLSSACIEGMLASSAPFLAVMDADMQHDESLLPKMLCACRSNDADVVIGTRYAAGGGIGDWTVGRAKASRLATRLSEATLRVKVSDPMSGFFMLRRDVLLPCLRNRFSGVGFKVLLDLLSSAPEPLRVVELPYRFRQRLHGDSKLDAHVVMDFAMLLLDKSVGRWVPTRFVAFSLIGGLGVLVHLVFLAVFYKGVETSFVVAQTVAAVVALTSNYVLNNALTYRDLRLRGLAMIKGWFTFSAACSVGAVANVGIASYLFQINTYWVASAIAGILIGAVWNYAVTAVYTWHQRPA